MNHFARNSLAIAVSLACASAVAEQTQQDEKAIEKIIVTGQKIEQSLQDTKESVAVFTGAILEERNLDELRDVFLQTPGASGDQFGFRIRGVRNSDGASQPNRGDLASVVIDGVTVSGWVKSEAVGALWDVGQVEVLRGPQSTNLGRNALAGAVVVNTNDPVYQNEGKVRVGFGEYGKTEFKGVGNINLVDGISAIRFSAETTETDGFVNNITRNEKDYGATKNSVYRLKWLYQPSEDFTSSFTYQRIESEYGSPTTYLGEHSREARISESNDTSIFDTDADLLSLTLDYVINSQWTATSITAYQDGERVRFNDQDSSARTLEQGGGIVSRFSEDSNWSQEFRFNYDADDVRGSSGIYFSGIDAKRSQNNIIGLNLPPLFDDFSPGLGAVLTTTAVLPIALYAPIYDTRQSGFTNVDTSTWAAFTQWEVDLSDKWTASFGVRYDSEEQEFSTASATTSNYVLPATGGPLGSINLGGITVDQVVGLINQQLRAFTSTVPQADKTEDFSNLLPHAGITYKWNDDVSTSFFVKKSYRSGGSELTLLNGVNNFDAEELWNYEASLRAIVLDGKGVFNANVYYSDWTDQQVAIQEPGTTNEAFTMTVNAGESTLSGVEASFTYELTANIDFYAGLAYSKTEYDKFKSPDGTEDYSGNRFRYAPEGTGSIGINYANDSGFYLNTAVTYTGSSFSTIQNDREMDSYTLVNVNAGYELADWKFEVYAKNLTDKLYDVNNNIRRGDGTPGQVLGAPREAGARVTYSF